MTKDPYKSVHARGEVGVPLLHVDDEQSGVLVFTILFTTVTDTLMVLHDMSRLLSQLRARIQIFVAYVIPYPLPIDKRTFNPDIRMRKLITLCKQMPITTRIDIWLCRDMLQCVHDGLTSRSVVLIGGRRSWWPLSFENRVARQLKKDGHEVIFVAPPRTPTVSLRIFRQKQVWRVTPFSSLLRVPGKAAEPPRKRMSEVAPVHPCFVCNNEAQIENSGPLTQSTVHDAVLTRSKPSQPLLR